MPVLFLLFLIFGIWLQIQKTKSNRKLKETTESFWNKEQEANSVRRKDISDLPYLSFKIEELPVYNNSTDSTLQDYYARLLSLQDKKLLNLSSRSNTELKLEYGTANLDYLIQCDQAYNSLIVTLNKMGCYLFEIKQYDDSLLVLEYALRCDSDISSTFITLAKLYLKKQDNKSLNALLKRAQSLTTLSKDKTIQTIEELRLKDMLLTPSDHIQI